ncbi:MAG: HAD family phosphatase [Coriobacteriales bacterium]|nr:HAD family phosphatase [Coriobacteriales bacterium]
MTKEDFQKLFSSIGIKPKGIIFDFDGTIADTWWVWHEVDRLFCEKHNIKVPEQYMDILTILGFEAGAKYTIENFGIELTVDEIIHEWEDLALKSYAENVVLKLGVKDLLKDLNEAEYPLAIATSLNRTLLTPALENHDILKYFKTLCICDEVCMHGKKEPTVYLEAAKILGPFDPKDCVVFEDMPPAAQVAKSAGFYTIGVFDEPKAEVKDELIEICDFFIDDYRNFHL